MASASSPISDLIQLTQEIPENGDKLSLKIQHLCSKIMDDIPQQGKEMAVQYLAKLKERFLGLKESGLFQKAMGGKAAEKALKEVIVKLDPLDQAFEKLKKSALEDTENFEKFLKETGGAALHPDLLMKIIGLLAQKRPVSLIRVLTSLKLSTAQKNQILPLLQQAQPFLYALFTKPMNQAERINLYLSSFPDASPWDAENLLLSLFRAPCQLTLEQRKKHVSQVDNGICQGSAIQHLSGLAYEQSHVRFLQSASQTGHMIEANRPYLIEVGKQMLSHPEKFASHLERFEKILGLPLKNAALDDALCFYVGSAAHQFYQDPENKKKYQNEADLFKVLTDEVAAPFISYSEMPASFLKKEKLVQSGTLVKEKPLAEFLDLTEFLQKGSYRVVLVDPINHKGHAVSFSLDDLTFCDPNDLDPETLEPVVRQFQSREDFLVYINTYLAILYKPDGFSIFNLTRFTKIDP